MTMASDMLKDIFSLNAWAHHSKFTCFSNFKKPVCSFKRFVRKQFANIADLNRMLCIRRCMILVCWVFSKWMLVCVNTVYNSTS